MNCLVTGAGGFIGSHLVEELQRRGHSVRSMVRYGSDGGLHNLMHLQKVRRDRAGIMAGDIRDPRFVRGMVEGSHWVFHLAALVSVPYSFLHVRDVFDVNVGGTLNVAEACLADGQAKMIHISSSEVFGKVYYLPMDERHPTTAMSPYAASKIAADALVQSMRLQGLNAATVRPFNTYGPRQSPRAVVQRILSQLILGGQTGVVLGNLAARRDLTYVRDTVGAMIKVAEWNAPAGDPAVFNVGQGDSVSIADILDMAVRVTGISRPAEVSQDQMRGAAEVDVLACNATRIRGLLDWRPWMGLERGMQACAHFIERHKEMYSEGPII